jgi:hypothetical protein
MAHFAKIQKGKVVKVIAAEAEFFDNYIDDSPGKWVQTSYNTFGGQHLLGGTPFRKNYAGIGYTYDKLRDAFIPPKPYNSWILNEDTCLWEAPVAYPTDDNDYQWNEETQQMLGADLFGSITAVTPGATNNIDFSLSPVFTLTPNQNSTLNITNAEIGIVKDVVVTGSGNAYTLSFTVNGVAGTFNKISGTYDDTASTKNLIQIVCVNTTEFWYTISQIAT